MKLEILKSILFTYMYVVKQCRIRTKQFDEKNETLLNSNPWPTVQKSTCYPTELLCIAIKELMKIHYIADIDISSDG
jgi:hypothetical protein